MMRYLRLIVSVWHIVAVLRANASLNWAVKRPMGYAINTEVTEEKEVTEAIFRRGTEALTIAELRNLRKSGIGLRKAAWQCSSGFEGIIRQVLRLRGQSLFSANGWAQRSHCLWWRAKDKSSLGMQARLSILNRVDSGRCLDSKLKGARDGDFMVARD